MKLAIVVFNLGGPDGPAAVRPFLANLFRDPAIISLPAVMRYPLASLIAKRREKEHPGGITELRVGRHRADPRRASREGLAKAIEQRLVVVDVGDRYPGDRR